MTTSKIVIGIIIVLVVIGGGYLLLGNNDTGEPNQNGEAVTQNGVEKKMAFSDFVRTTDGSYRCTVNQNVDDQQVSGIAYVNNGMIRGEYSGVAQGMEIDADVIIRDGFAYTWTSIAPNIGIKVPINDEAETNNQSQTSGTYSFSDDQVGDYDCQPWTADPSVFELPAGVNFTEIQ